MNFIISQLAEYFEKLPGVGPKQAYRFVYSLLNKNVEFLKNFSRLIANLKQEVKRCPDCQRFVENKCQICTDLSRSKHKLLIVEKDVDLDNIERAGFYDGHYFVLAELMPTLTKEMPKEIKMKELFEKVKKDALAGVLKEVILALSATIEGDNTVRYTEKILEPIIKKTSIKISRLGRGLSTGTELEYSDKDTIIHALKNRR